ncbi:MAG: hypothetical protein EHM40_10945 [Chloroflexi bacterium]|nr:MAG: hypothetical protein EHM40_10945 [Chloroflexota bacterium]
MKKFILFYKGPATPPGTSHDKWPAWFNKVGDQLVDMGSPMENGFVVHSNGSTSDAATNLNGYSIIQARNKNDVISLMKDHPFLSLGKGEYSIEIFEVPKA